MNLYGDLPIYLFVMPVDVYGYIYINGDYIMDKKDNYNKDNELDADKIINSVDGEDKFSDEIKISDEVKVNETDKVSSDDKISSEGKISDENNVSVNNDNTVILDDIKEMNTTVDVNDFVYTKHFNTTSDIKSKNADNLSQNLDLDDVVVSEEEINRQIEESLKKLTEDEVLLSREVFLSNEEIRADVSNQPVSNESITDQSVNTASDIADTAEIDLTKDTTSADDTNKVSGKVSDKTSNKNTKDNKNSKRKSADNTKKKFTDNSKVKSEDKGKSKTTDNVKAKSEDNTMTKSLNSSNGKAIDNPPETQAKKPFYKNKKVIIPAVAALVGIVALIIVININNNSYNNTYKKAEQAYAAGNYEEALENYLKASNSDEGNKNTDMLNHMADTYFRLEKYDQSIATYNQVLKLDEKNGKAVEGLLANYTKKNDVNNINSILRKYENAGMDEYLAAYDVTAPKASIDSGSYDNSQTIKFTSDENTTIYYTLDGNDPSETSRIYTRPITVNEGYTVVSAVAYNSAGVRSKIATYEYKIDYMIPGTPTLSLSNGKYVSGTTVSVSVPDGATVYYTIDGSTPTKDSVKYEGEITLPMGHTKLSVVAVNDKSEKTSDVVTGEYDIVNY